MRYILPWVIVVAWALFIFTLSHQPAHVSRDVSLATTAIVKETVQTINPDRVVEMRDLHSTVRQLAHVFLYLVLGVLLVYSLGQRSGVRLRHALVAMIFCILYAISDEIHQMYVPGRTAEVVDVVYDGAGAAAGILIYVWIYRLFGPFKGSEQERK